MYFEPSAEAIALPRSQTQRTQTVSPCNQSFETQTPVPLLSLCSINPLDRAIDVVVDTVGTGSWDSGSELTCACSSGAIFSISALSTFKSDSLPHASSWHSHSSRKLSELGPPADRQI
jgi:hypothetical protein